MGRIRQHQFLVTVFADCSRETAGNMVKKDVGSWEGSKPVEEQIEVLDVWVQPIPPHRGKP